MPTSSVRVRRGEGGRWTARLWLGRDRATGREIRPQRSWPADMPEEEAQAACDRWAAGFAPAAAEGSSKRLGSMLAAYIADPVRGFRENTRATYETDLRCYVEPLLGDIPYDGLEPYEVESAYRALLEGRGGAGPISPATLVTVHGLLCGAYRAWEPVIGRDPMRRVPKPTLDGAEPFALSDWDQDALMARLVEDMGERGCRPRDVSRRTVATAAYLALMTGLRCGEVCALRRVDWRRAQHDLHVAATVVERPHLARQPRTKHGAGANVAVGRGVEARLADLVSWQAGWLNRPVASSAPLLTLSPRATLLRPSTVSRRFRWMAGELGLPPETTFHTLRHTHATWLIMHGWDVKTVKERLRHSDEATTLRLYTSVMPGRDARAAEAIAEALEGGGHAGA